MPNDNKRELITFTLSEISHEDGAKITDGIKRRIRESIEAEDSENPVTDEEIIRIIRSEGTIVTARAIEKYRNQMEIADAGKRKFKFENSDKR